MIVIVCIDDDNGMMFNKRRQSRDRAVIEDILSMAGEKTIWIQKFSAPLFEKFEKNVMIDDEFFDKAKEGEFCFVENCSILPVLERVEKIVVYRWNREYPADLYFDVDLSQWNVGDSSEFQGFSHERIVKEIYIRGN